MKTKYLTILSLTLLLAVLLASCGGLPAAAGQRAGGDASLAQTAAAQPTEAAPEPSATPTILVSTPTTIPTQDAAKVQADAAGQTAQAYFDAVAGGDTEAAAELLSSFSLMVFEITQGDAASALNAQLIDGLRWSDLVIEETIPFDEDTILVRVAYTQANVGKPGEQTPTAAPSPTAKATAKAAAAGQKPAAATPAEDAAAGPANGETVEALWPMRLENGAWLYNWENLIDFRTLDARAQTMNGVTVMPVQMNRYSDRIALSMLVQNRTNASVVFGQANETLGTFTFNDQAVTAEKTQWILNPLRSVPDATLEVKGLFQAYPDSIAIRTWNNYDVEPWYVFQLQ